MKKIALAFITMLISNLAISQTDEKAVLDSIEKTFTYQHGKISLKGGVGEITVPQGFKYLDDKQAERVLVELWGNPKSDDLSLGLILPENQGVTNSDGYVFNIQYEQIGYVKDDDADEIDYDELLTQIQEDAVAENDSREKQGFPAIKVIGWAAKPFYDKENKILHWAKEIQFGNEPLHTLNYNVRILGRKGVIVLNAISSINDLPLVKKDIHHVLNIVKFNDGFKYSDFNPSLDEVAAWTIGSLVAGKVLAKVGFFALLAKFGKFIVLGVIALFSGLIKKLRGKKDEEPAQTTEIAEVVEQETIERE